MGGHDRHENNQVLIKTNNLMLPTYQNVFSVCNSIIDELSRQLAAYLMVGAVVMLCGTG